jgi:DNA-binding MarR family transcriptional regulator
MSGNKMGANKREKIREMLSSPENYNNQEIAESVGTTPANVSKEKSKLKTEGLMLRSQSRKLQVSERKDEVFFIPEDGRRRRSLDSYNYSPHYRFIDVRELDEEALKTLYSELNDRKKPGVIIARHGFHPEVVEKEYQRFLRLNENSVIGAFQKKLAPFLQCALNVDLSSKLDKEGYLSEDEFREFIELRLNGDLEVQRKLDARRNQSIRRLPHA